MVELVANGGGRMFTASGDIRSGSIPSISRIDPMAFVNVSIHRQADFRSRRSSGIEFENLERQPSASCVRFTPSHSASPPPAPQHFRLRA
jgi:hypothetical protein